MNKVVRFLLQLFGGCCLIGIYFIAHYCYHNDTDVSTLGLLAIVGLGLLIYEIVKFLSNSRGEK